MAFRKISVEEKEEILKKICDLVRYGTPLEDACYEAGIHPATIYRWMEKDEKVAMRIWKARMNFRQKIRNRILNVIARLERQLGLVSEEGKIRDKALLKIYLEHLRWLAEKKLSDEFFAKQVQVVEGNLRHSVEEDMRNVQELVKSLYEIKNTSLKKRKKKKKKTD